MGASQQSSSQGNSRNQSELSASVREKAGHFDLLIPEKRKMSDCTVKLILFRLYLTSSYIDWIKSSHVLRQLTILLGL